MRPRCLLRQRVSESPTVQFSKCMLTLFASLSNVLDIAQKSLDECSPLIDGCLDRCCPLLLRRCCLGSEREDKVIALRLGPRARKVSGNFGELLLEGRIDDGNDERVV